MQTWFNLASAVAITLGALTVTSVLPLERIAPALVIAAYCR